MIFAGFPIHSGSQFMNITRSSGFRLIILCFSAVVGSAFLINAQTPEAPKSKPLKALLVAGGCCHDYAGQHEVLFKGIQERANVQVDVWWTDDKSVNPPLPLYDNPDWAKGYDVIIHDECAAGNRDLKVLDNILEAHKTIPSIHLHCAMHSFRGKTDKWFKHLGIQSSSHGPQEPIDIEFIDKKHPIVETLEDWTTINEELYNNVNVFDAQPLAMGTQKYTRKGEAKEDAAIVVWVNEKQGARSFSTTLGHNTETVQDGRYLDLVTRGLLWSMDQLNADYLGKAFTGENKVTFLPKVDAPKPEPKAAMGAAPKDATLAKVTASTEETGKNNFAWRAIDGDKNTRWCAGNGNKPQWLQLEFEKQQTLSGAKIAWESGGTAYQYKIEGSADGKSWNVLTDAADNKTNGDSESTFSAKAVRFVKVTCTGTTNPGNWASIREFTLKGEGIKSLYPKLDEKQKETAIKAEKAESDPYAKAGNIPPKIVALTEKEEKDILSNVKVPEGFDVSVFSDWRSANYPVYVAAAPNGDLYVSSDGNGSLGRNAGRGRVLRLRDTDHDGTADEVTEFVKDVDSPRGLIWDQDRLYLLHPPHISVYFDKDGDGVAEDSKRLIEGIAFGFADRPADHTTNGLDMGIDGWIYIAGGDFGFMKAKGTDGTELQHRGGGVIRFRPDGSGLEIFATGTRNILGTPISPLLDIFARDNTNDGGGWDVRFHHFTGLEDHGYPRLYKNFGEEHIQPLADYGGGSGCGSVYISEPGFPAAWNNAPFTCDWGTGALWQHSVQRKGATFEETKAPEPFIKMTRPTDADVDGMSAVYQASWRGPATFKWAGPEAGYIVKVTPKDFKPEPLPDFKKMSNAELVAALDSPSRIRTMAAQRALLRRDLQEETTEGLLALAQNPEKPLEARVAAVYAIALSEESAAALSALIEIAKTDVAIAPFATRALGDLKFANGDIPKAAQDLVAGGFSSGDPRTATEAIISAARLGMSSAADGIANLLGSDDPQISHVAFRALAKLGASEAALAKLDSDTHGKHAAFALMRMHDPAVVDNLLSRLSSEKNPTVRERLLSILARLAQQEAEWTGDSWGTRPDTRGPYYQLADWSETEKILAALKSALESGTPDEAAFIVKEMSRNRIQSNDALNSILSLAKKNPKVVPDAVTQLSTADSIPAEGIDILLRVLKSDGSEFGFSSMAEAVTVLAKTDNQEVVDTSLAAFEKLQKNVHAAQAAQTEVSKIEDEVKKKSELKYARGRVNDARKMLETATTGFLKSPKLENHHLAIEHIAAEKPDSTEGFWANAALLELASRKDGSPESRELSQKAVDVAWQNPKQKVALIKAASTTKNRSLDERIQIALNSPDKAVSDAAKNAAKSLKIQPKGADKTPKISTLDPAKALAEVIKHKGDVALGESVFSRASCVACHTTSQQQAQKGPYLGNIFETYKRPELAEAILDPNKTIAQGFATNLIVLKDGNTQMMGFVTNEQADQVTVRDIASKEHVFKKADIDKREEMPMSMMPPGLMMNFTIHEFASLLDYLEHLSKKK